MRKGFVTFQTFSLAITWLKLLRILLLNMTFPFMIGENITIWWMAFICTGFRTPRIFMIMFLIKFLLLLWVKRSRSQNNFCYILRTRAYVDVENKWTDCLDVLDELDWNDIHRANFNCTIETQLRSFYFKLFHRAICTNQFLHKIGRFDSPNCSFCKKFPETLLHLFCQCEKISPLWDDLCFLIYSISEESFIFFSFWKMFGVTDTSEHGNCMSYLFLCLKYYIHRCKF